MSSRKGKKPRAGDSSSRSSSEAPSRGQPNTTAGFEQETNSTTHNDTGASSRNQRTGKAPNRAAPSKPPAQNGGHPPHGKNAPNRPPTQSRGHSRAAPSRTPGQGGRSTKPQSKESLGSTQKKSEKSLRRSVSPRKEQYSHLLDETVGRGDMVLLEPLTEEGLIENLQLRYKAGEIYVSAV